MKRTKNSMYKKPFLPLAILLIFIALLTAAHLSSAQTIDDKNEIYKIIDSYYTYFGEKNMDAYLNTQFLDHLSKNELLEKKSVIKNMWSQFNSGYSLSDKEDWKFSIDNNIAIAFFRLSANIMDKDYNTVKSYKQAVTAILFKTKTKGWKIFNIVPTTVFNFNAVADLLPKKYEKAKSPTDYTSSKDPSCDSQGHCAKRGASLHNQHQETNTKCNFNPELFKKKEGFSIEEIPGISTLIGNDKTIKLVIDDASMFYYHILDGTLKPITAGSKIDFLVVTDSCTIQRIEEGSNPESEYLSGNIKIKGQTLRSKISAEIGKLIFTIYSWFSSKQPFEIWVEAETGDLQNAGKYSFEGPTSRGPGELYLGTKDSFAKYVISSEYEGPAHLYISVSDDGLHPSGSRDAIFIINNNEKLRYNHISKNTETKDSHWEWINVGIVNLKKGKNTIIIKKPEQTSAAFIIDKFVLSEEEIRLR